MVQKLIGELGPSASRALVGVVCERLSHRKRRGDVPLLRTLYWSIPESPKAVATLHDWLSKPHVWFWSIRLRRLGKWDLWRDRLYPSYAAGWTRRNRPNCLPKKGLIELFGSGVKDRSR